MAFGAGRRKLDALLSDFNVPTCRTLAIKSCRHEMARVMTNAVRFPYTAGGNYLCARSVFADSHASVTNEQNVFFPRLLVSLWPITSKNLELHAVDRK